LFILYISSLVWVDILAVRQWPGSAPDLDFGSTIRHCKSFVLVCTHLPEIIEMHESDVIARNISVLSPATRRQVAFFRVWCLVEIQAAAMTQGMAVIMKGGSHHIKDDGSVEFNSNRDMLTILLFLVDIANAEATVPSDRERILQQVEQFEGGTEGLNNKVKGIISGSLSCVGDAVVQCAACGDRNAIEAVISRPDSIVTSAGAGYADLVRQLIASGADVRARDVQHGGTSMVFAAIGGHVNCMQILLEHGADVNEKSSDGITPLLYAAMGNQRDCLQWLLKNGANVNDRNDNDGQTALMYAAVGGNTGCLRILLEAGAAVNERDSLGRSALMLAAFTGHKECIQCLLVAKADPDIKDNSGMNAYMWAMSKRHAECTALLKPIKKK
jgi:hypothetical protein